MKEANSLVGRGAVEARLGHICYVGVAAVTEIIEEVFPVTLGVTYVVALLVLRTTATMTKHAVTCIKPCQRMVAFWVTCIITNFADITVS